MKMRKLRKQPIATRLFTNDNPKVAAEVLGHDDEITDLVEREKKHLGIAQRARLGKVLAAAAPACPSKSGAASSSDGNGAGAASSDQARIFHAPLDNKQYSLAEARSDLPLAKGCVTAIHKDTTWMVKYPRKVPPKSHTANWYDSNREALIECLEWAWAAHGAETGARCPFPFRFR